MAYNKAKEEYRWNQWKAEEEKILREQGVDEETDPEASGVRLGRFQCRAEIPGTPDLASGLYGTAPGRKRNQRVPAGERRSPAGYRRIYRGVLLRQPLRLRRSAFSQNRSSVWSAPTP